MMKNGIQWYAVYTKPCWEKKVAGLLAMNGIEHYCPLQRIIRRWSDRKKVIMEPLFKSYVFVRISEKAQIPVRQVSGVLSFVQYLGRPAVIKDEEIDIIRQFLNEYRNVRLERMEFNINDHVRVVSGPFMQMEGDVLEVKHKTVKVLLPSLGFLMTAEIEKSNLVK
ncbi:UpxY family transcription antiterminator [Paraflavitalea sp. CAU 1676]|uniref:UpxY family transcription antiterminator n=1 Tax=Paraflavitalea sp. CAU 1676 TaxID=3032598 RepID=UPI0023DBE05C|nr:UpxY family transcription antiterminator [Paraflavitalea sp. CAU 1676]MDF2189644.1 UpxY family transcription antiterminator [Paraflavitalea sp. CAU 1676]